VDTKFGLCVDCGLEEARDCPLYLCLGKDGFLVICCIVYMVNNGLAIVQRMDGLLGDED